MLRTKKEPCAALYCEEGKVERWQDVFIGGEGSGHSTKHWHEDCDDCGGTGEVDVMVRCYACDASPLADGSLCKACDGEGYLPQACDPEEEGFLRTINSQAIEIERLKANAMAEARRTLSLGLSEGTTCPCCSRFAKEYKRKLNSEVARFVIWLNVTAPTGEYVHISEWITGGGDYGKASKWGLAELRENDETAKKTSGFWRITPKGRDFARGLISVQQYAHIYNNERTGFSGKYINVRTALGSSFDYSDLMGEMYLRGRYEHI